MSNREPLRDKPLYDWTERDLVEQLRAMYEGGHYVATPNDLVRELERKAAVRQRRVAFVTSVVTSITATVAVVFSAIALLSGA